MALSSGKPHDLLFCVDLSFSRALRLSDLGLHTRAPCAEFWFAAILSVALTALCPFIHSFILLLSRHLGRARRCVGAYRTGTPHVPSVLQVDRGMFRPFWRMTALHPSTFNLRGACTHHTNYCHVAFPQGRKSQTLTAHIQLRFQRFPFPSLHKEEE